MSRFPRMTILSIAVSVVLVAALGGAALADKPSQPPGGSDQQEQIDALVAQVEALDARVVALEELLTGVTKTVSQVNPDHWTFDGRVFADVFSAPDISATNLSANFLSTFGGGILTNGSVIVAGTLTVDTINEFTPDAGVTVEGVLFP